MIELPKDYRPSEKEEYMNEMQLEYFKQKLIDWRRNLLRGMARALTDLQETDRATKEIEQALALKSRDRDRQLIAKINAALDRIEDGTYGYCLETGDPIGVYRLEAQPTATLCIEAQEQHERRQKTQIQRD